MILGTAQQLLEPPECAGLAELIADDSSVRWVDQDVFNESEQVPTLSDDLAPNHVSPPRETGQVVNGARLFRSTHGDRVRADRMNQGCWDHAVGSAAEDGLPVYHDQARDHALIGIENDFVNLADLFGSVHIDHRAVEQLAQSQHSFSLGLRLVGG